MKIENILLAAPLATAVSIIISAKNPLNIRWFIEIIADLTFDHEWNLYGRQISHFWLAELFPNYVLVSDTHVKSIIMSIEFNDEFAGAPSIFLDLSKASTK